MTDHPDDWYEDLLDRESNPDEFAGSRSIRDNLADHAKDYASDKVKDGAKNLAKKAGKELTKEGAKAGAEAGAEAAAGAASGAAAGSGAAATGAGVAASTGVETAGIGVIVGAVIAALGSKTGRRFAIGFAILLVMAQLLVTITTVLAPIIIVKEVSEQSLEVAKSLVDNRATRLAVKAGTLGLKGAKATVGAGKDAVDWAGDKLDAITPDINIPGIGDTGARGSVASVDSSGVNTQTAVLAATDGAGATGTNPDSRIAQLAQAMADQGFFRTLAVNYGLNVRTKNGKDFDILLDKKLVKTVHSEEAVQDVFENNKDIRARIQMALDDELHVFDYSNRVTLAEKGLSKYSTAQLFVPGADTAKEDDQVATVRKSSFQTQNTPFLSRMSSDLNCSSCTSWIPDASSTDEDKLAANISPETRFNTNGSLFSLMKARIKEDGTTDEPGFLDWYRYVNEMDQKARKSPAEAKNDEFIQAAAAVRKDQSSRLWFHWQTATDQYKIGAMTDKAASALFQNFSGGASSKAYVHLSGQTGGVGFKDYDKVNDNQPNVVKAVYDAWKKENPEDAKLVQKALDSDLISFLDSLAHLGLGNFVRNFLDKLYSGTETERALQSAFGAGSRIMLPVCDAAKGGTDFMNCMYAGAESSARDVGISDYGFTGVYSKADKDTVLAYNNEIDQKVAAQKPLIERMASLDGRNSFARKLVLQAAIPIDSNKNFSSVISYLGELPSRLTKLAVAPFSGSVLAAEDEQSINNIDRSGVKLRSMLDTPISKTLDNPTGDAASCGEVPINQENLCKSDETTLLAMQAKFGLLSSGGAPLSFTVASYNVLDAGAHPDDSKAVGGCNTKPVPDDPTCYKTRTARQVQIITGQAGAPAFDILGTQETSPEQYRLLKSSLSGYQVFPGDASRLSNSKDGEVAIWWNAGKFTKFTQGKAAGISNTSKDIKNPWVGLQAASGQKVYVMSIHYPNTNYGGDPATIRRASKLTMDWVRSKVGGDNLVIVMGDFNDELNNKLAYCVYTEDGLMQHVHDMEQGDNPSAGCGKPDTAGIDHIYASPTAGVTAAGWTHMAHAGIVANASDHEPVYSTLTLPGSGSGQPVPYTNPVYKGSAPDPGVIRGDDKTYHVYATGNVHLSSPDLVHWKKLSGGWGIKGAPRFDCNWAPDVAKVGSLYVMTWAGIPDCSSVGAISNTSAIRYATSTSAGGPFQYGGTLTSQGYAIDPHLFVDEDGKTWLEFGGGVLYLVQVKLNGTKMDTVGATKTIFVKTSAPTIENGWIQKRNGWYYLFYSQGHWNKSDGAPEYSTKIARSKSVDGPYQPTTYRDLLSGKGGDFWGPGGGSITTDDAGTDWFVYHDWYKGSRVLMIDPISYTGDGWPAINGGNGPSTTLQSNGPVIGTATGGDIAAAPGGWVLPVEKSAWETDGQRWLAPHTTLSDAWTNNIKAAADINIGSGDADCGKPVYSMLAGTVVSNPPTYTMQIKSTIDGKTVILTYAHGNGLKQSGSVQPGDQIMTIGKNSRYSGISCHLHLEISYNGKPVCPQDVLPLVAKGQSPDLASLSTKATYTCK